MPAEMAGERARVDAAHADDAAGPKPLVEMAGRAVVGGIGDRGLQNRAARAGDVILFESWLRHEVPPNRTTAERISISFNFSWS